MFWSVWIKEWMRNGLQCEITMLELRIAWMNLLIKQRKELNDAILHMPSEENKGVWKNGYGKILVVKRRE